MDAFVSTTGGGTIAFLSAAGGGTDDFASATCCDGVGVGAIASSTACGTGARGGEGLGACETGRRVVITGEAAFAASTGGGGICC